MWPVVVAAFGLLAWAPSPTTPRLHAASHRPVLLPRMCDAERQALEAERLALEAERKALAAERAALEAERLVSALEPAPAPAPTPTPAPPPPTPVDIGPMANMLRTALTALTENREPSQPVEDLVAAATEAWTEAMTTQREEIEILRARVPLAEAAYTQMNAVKFEKLWETASAEVNERERANKETTSFRDLLQLSEEESEDESDLERKSARARKLSKAIFDFHSYRIAAPTINAEGQQDDTEVVVPGEGVVLLNRTRARLELLERHDAAGVVEYRLFGAALSASQSFSAAAAAGLPAAGEEDAAVAQAVGRYIRFLPNFDAEELRQDLDGEAVTEEEKLNAEELMAAAKGEKRPPFWLEEHGNLARRWQQFDTEEDLEAALDISFPVPVFPALVFLMCVRLGSFEPVATYVVARTVARLNLQALEPAKALAPAKELDRQIAVQEQQLIDDFAQSAVVWLSAGSFAIVVLSFIGLFLAWGAVRDIVLVLLAGPAPPDPFSGL